MAWPFTTPAAGPTSLVAPGTHVPLALTAITTNTVYLLGMNFINNTVQERTVSVFNTAGTLIYKATLQPGMLPQPYAPTFEPSVGLKWIVDSGDGNDVIAHIWGY